MNLFFPHHEEWKLSYSSKLKIDSRSIEFPSNLWKQIFQYLYIFGMSQLLPVNRTFFRDVLQAIEENARKQRNGKDVKIIFGIRDCTIPYPFLWGVCFQDFIDKREMHCVSLLHFYKICPTVNSDFKQSVYGFYFKTLVESRMKYSRYTILPDVPSPWNLDESIVRSILKKEGKEDLKYERAIAFWSCYLGKDELVEESLDRIEKIDEKDSEKDDTITQLLYSLACGGGEISTIKILQKIYPTNENDLYSRPAMFWGDNEILVVACIRGSIDMMEFLISEGEGEIESDDFEEGFELACACGNLALVKHLVENHSFEPCGIVDACREGHYEIAKYLLEEGTVDPNWDDSESVRRALENKHHHIVELLLLDPRVPSDQAIQAEFQLAVEGKKFDLAFQMLENPKLDPSRDDDWTLRNACYTSDPAAARLVRKLLEDDRVDPSVATYNQCLMRSSYSGNLGIVELLLGHELIDPSVNKNDPIRWSARKGHSKVVELLLKHPKVDPKAIDDEAFGLSYGHCVSILEDIREGKVNVESELCEKEEEFGRFFQTVKVLVKDGRVNTTKFEKDEVIKHVRSQLKYESDGRILGLIKEDEEERMKFLNEQTEEFLEKKMVFRISLCEDNTVKWDVQISKLFFVF